MTGQFLIEISYSFSC